MARSESIDEPWQPPGTHRHLFKRPDASYPRATEDTAMKLGLAIGYSGAHMDLPVVLVQRAEELGYDSVWSAEAYGSDAITPLAFLAAKTSRIKLGTGIMQLAARTPANAAMSAASIDAMAGGGRFIAGLGVSGPQIVEGWYGQPWGKPYYRVKDYVAMMRKIFKREGPVTHEGREISLPCKGEGSAGLAKPLKSILHMNPDIPIYLATGGEAMVKLTAEIADGWLPMGFVPGAMEEYGPWLEEGFRRAGNGRSLKDFTIHRHRARRVGRSEITGRPTGAHPRTLPRLGGQRRGFA
jgi:F420-dependent oxidoreductase-like protein